MTNSPRTTLRIPPEIQKEMNEYCQANNVSTSQFVLQAILEKLGRNDLKTTIRKPNRPKSE